MALYQMFDKESSLKWCPCSKPIHSPRLDAYTRVGGRPFSPGRHWRWKWRENTHHSSATIMERYIAMLTLHLCMQSTQGLLERALVCYIFVPPIGTIVETIFSSQQLLFRNIHRNKRWNKTKKSGADVAFLEVLHCSHIFPTRII